MRKVPFSLASVSYVEELTYGDMLRHYLTSAALAWSDGDGVLWWRCTIDKCYYYTDYVEEMVCSFLVFPLIGLFKPAIKDLVRREEHVIRYLRKVTKDFSRDNNVKYYPLMGLLSHTPCLSLFYVEVRCEYTEDEDPPQLPPAVLLVFAGDKFVFHFSLGGDVECPLYVCSDDLDNVVRIVEGESSGGKPHEPALSLLEYFMEEVLPCLSEGEKDVASKVETAFNLLSDKSNWVYNIAVPSWIRKELKRQMLLLENPDFPDLDLLLMLDTKGLLQPLASKEEFVSTRRGVPYL